MAFLMICHFVSMSEKSINSRHFAIKIRGFSPFVTFRARTTDGAFLKFVKLGSRHFNLIQYHFKVF